MGGSRETRLEAAGRSLRQKSAIGYSAAQLQLHGLQSRPERRK